MHRASTIRGNPTELAAQERVAGRREASLGDSMTVAGIRLAWGYPCAHLGGYLRFQ